MCHIWDMRTEGTEQSCRAQGEKHPALNGSRGLALLGATSLQKSKVEILQGQCQTKSPRLRTQGGPTVPHVPPPWLPGAAASC